MLVDAAAELPPRENLQAIAATGADLVVFSGGKAIRGPQATGILCGRRDLVGAAALQMLDIDEHLELWQPPPELIDRNKLQGMPRQGIGRGFKVSKEQIVALIVALRMFARGEYDQHLVGYTRCLQAIAKALSGAAARTTLHENRPECLPILEIAGRRKEAGSLGDRSLPAIAGRLTAVLRRALGPGRG